MSNISEFILDTEEKEIIQRTIENEVSNLESRKYEIILKALEIVEKYNFDPWNLDLAKFVDIFMNEINQEFRDFPVAGRIVYMAWLNLRNKSERVIPKTELNDDSNYGLDDGLDYFVEPKYEGEEFQVSLSYIPEDKRNISIHDLIDAIKNVKFISKNKKKEPKRVISEAGEYSHPEDIYLIIREIWNRIIEVESETFPMDSISSGELEDSLDVFVSSLYLSFYGRILLSQDVPYGTIWITVVDKNNVGSPIPETKMDDAFAI